MLKILEKGMLDQRGSYKFDCSASLNKGAVVYLYGYDNNLDAAMLRPVDGGHIATSAYHQPGQCYILYQEELDDELGTAAQDSITCGQYVSTLGQGTVVETTYFETTMIDADTTYGTPLGVSTAGKFCPYVSSIAQWVLPTHSITVVDAGKMPSPIAVFEGFKEAGDTDWARIRML